MFPGVSSSRARCAARNGVAALFPSCLGTVHVFVTAYISFYYCEYDVVHIFVSLFSRAEGLTSSQAQTRGAILRVVPSSMSQ